MALATFAAGCFWGVEAAFRELPGVETTRVGYIGGHTDNPSYRDVCTDRTGHAEAVEVTYDPDAVSFERLLETFWEIHDPTTVNRQGPDVGSQYRSAIFYRTAEEREAAERSRERLQGSGRYPGTVVTEIVPATKFYEAEEYHQQYLEANPHGYCGLGGTGVSCPVGVAGL